MVYLGRALRLPLLRKAILTMEAARKYRVSAGWSSGSRNAIHFNAPNEFGGLESR